MNIIIHAVFWLLMFLYFVVFTVALSHPNPSLISENFALNAGIGFTLSFGFYVVWNTIVSGRNGNDASAGAIISTGNDEEIE